MSFTQNSTSTVIAAFTTGSLISNHSNWTHSWDNQSSPRPKTDPLTSFTVPATMFAAGVIGNILAIIVLARSQKEHKRTVFYKLVGALACTDLLGTCATSPVTLAVYANHFKWIGGMPLCNYESFMLIFASCSTIFIICTMAVDRFVSICHPFLYDKHMTSGRMKKGIMAVWTFAFVMGCLPIIGLGENVIQFPGTWCFFTFTSRVIKNKIFAYFYAIIGLLGIIVTALSNFFVISVLVKMYRRAAKLNVCSACTQRTDRETQMMVLMIGIVIIFATCWCPFLVRIIVNQMYHEQVNVKADLMALRLASLNQILDPWIYILFRKEMFAKALKCIRSVTGKFSMKGENTRKTSNTTITKSMENNFDENDVFLSETGGTTISKTQFNERPSLQKLMSPQNPQCFGLQHPASLFCFSNLPTAFALSFGTEREAADVDKIKTEPV